MTQISPSTWPTNTILEVAQELLATSNTAASTSEQIAAAFVLNRMEFLPEGYTVVEAWERLDNWQRIVQVIQRDYSHLLAN